MLIIILAAIVLAAVICIPAWWYSGRQKYLHLWELALPAVPGPLWVLLTYAGIGAQSLGNMVEVPLVILAFAAMVYLKSFGFKRWGIPLKAGAIVLAALAVLVPLISRLVFPMMPE